MTLKFSKELSRNYSLFQIDAYLEFSKRRNPAFDVPINIGRPLFVYQGGPLVDIYFPPGEMKAIYAEFGKALADRSYFERLVQGSAEVLEKITPYFEQKERVADIEGLRELYELYLDFLYGESASWVAPHIEALPQDLRSRAMALRQATQHLSSMRDEMLDYNLKRLFPGLGQLVHFLPTKEVFSGLAEEELRPIAEKLAHGFVFFDGTYHTGEHRSVLRELDFELEDEKHSDDIKELHGQIACAGLARGKVKLVWTKDDNGKIQDGDILVSPMTRPDFLPAMKKALSFVTDEGGITCHAAIVAREMNKPCIIGTKIATKVLKDGDMVEVDAENGVVKKID